MQGTSTPLEHKGWVFDTLILSVIFCLLFFTFLGGRPLFTPDEGRYAEIAREMAVSGDFITPTLNGIKYFEKPALFYWLGAIAIKAGGVNILAVRCINAIIALLGCLAAYAAGRKLFGRTSGFIAAIVLSTSSLYFIMAHMVSLDLPVTVFLSMSLYGFLLAALADNPTYRLRYLLGAAVAAACAVLTKGLIGLVLPAMIGGTWILLMGEWRQLKRLPIWSALLVFFIIAAPWHILVNLRNPEFFHFYFIEQHFLRYTMPEIGHYQPAWFFIPTLIAGFFPWIVFLPQAFTASVVNCWQKRAGYASELFLIIWAVLIFAFFSFSKSKLIPYILPVMPALALLTGRYLAATLQRSTLALQAGYACLLISAVAMTYFMWNLSIPMTSPSMAALYLRAASFLLVAGTLLSALLARDYPRRALGYGFISAALFLVINHAAIRHIDTRTIQPLAFSLKELMQPGDEIITYNQYFQDLPFYVEQKVIILNWRNELSFGMQHQASHDWMIDNDQFWELWRSKQHIYMIMSKEEFKAFHERYPHEIMIIMRETPTNVLVTNMPLAITPS
jgi:4-amino-4-deoxy-L-arabinose transferase-like glycosyltransferase